MRGGFYEYGYIALVLSMDQYVKSACTMYQRRNILVYLCGSATQASRAKAKLMCTAIDPADQKWLS